jgi:hypothetical protein
LVPIAGRLSIEIEVRHAGKTKNAIQFRQVRFNGHVRHELLEVDVAADSLAPHRIERLIHLMKEIANRRIQNRVALELVIPWLEHGSVRRRIVAEVLTVVRLQEVPLEQVPGLVATCSREELAIDRLDDGENAFI